MGDRLMMQKRLNSLTLKFLAMALMLCDHLWATVIPGNGWLTAVGRLAFPIFAFQIAQGFVHTRSVKKYLGRLFLWALISKIPFNLMYGGAVFYPFHQNVLFTFCLALLLLSLLDRAEKRSRILFFLLVPVTFAAGYLLGMVTMVDYYGYGVLTVLVFWLADRLPHPWIFQLAGLWVINVGMMGGHDLLPGPFGPYPGDPPAGAGPSGPAAHLALHRQAGEVFPGHPRRLLCLLPGTYGGFGPFAAAHGPGMTENSQAG